MRLFASFHAVQAKLSPIAVAAALALSALGCEASAPATESAATDEGAIEEDLTSVTALARQLEFDGAQYVSTGSSDYEILQVLREQTQSAFGALREANCGVNSRELKDLDVKNIKKTVVTVVDTANPKAATKQMTRVTYKYTDTAVFPKTLASRSSLSLGLLAKYDNSQLDRITKECTSGDSHAIEFRNSIWYVFNPSLSKCKTAITAEQKIIDADRAKLTDKTKQVTLSDVNRLYLPMTARLTGDKTNKGTSWPEYNRLWAGGVQKDKVVISMVSGMMADWAAGEKHDTIDDEGYPMFFEGLREIFKARSGFKFVKSEPVEDLTTFTVGKVVVKNVTWDQIMGWQLDAIGWPAGITTPDQKTALRAAVGSKLVKHWLTFEAPVSVAIGKAAARPVTIQLNTYFGAETDPTPHKRAIKQSDVFIYNGHSYIGYGPLDPSNFSAGDFPPSYQILFINGCVSYNYYEKDYIPLKSGGTKNLELVTNGLESWVNGSGPAMGRFVGGLIDGKANNYIQLLTLAQFTGYGYAWGQDALRVVDGELDNVYNPTKTPIVVK